MIQNPIPPVIVQAPPPPPGVDPNLLVTQLVPLIGGVVTLVAVVVLARWFLHSPIGEAIAEGIRLRRRRRYGLGADGEGYTSFTIASPTGEGLTTAASFTRERRCTLKDHFRFI